MCAGFTPTRDSNPRKPVEYHAADLESVGVRDHTDEGELLRQLPFVFSQDNCRGYAVRDRELLSHYDNDPIHKRDWMKRLSATFAGGILLRKSCGIDRGKKENQLWTSSASISAKSPAKSAS